MKKQTFRIALIIIAGIAGIWLLSLWIFGGPNSHEAELMHNEHEHLAGEHSEELHQQITASGDTVWVCPMHPNQQFSEPGSCPICAMTLTAQVSAPQETHSEHSGMQMSNAGVHLSAQEVAAAHILVESVRNEVPQKSISLPAKLAIDERSIMSISAHFGGRITELMINFTGQYVSHGQVVAKIYSPELIVAQQEFLESAKFKESNPQLYASARKKLEYLELTKEQIEGIEQLGVVRKDMEVVSHHHGYVIERKVNTEDHVMSGGVMLRVAPLDKLWLLADVYEKDIQGIKLGDMIDVELSAFPQKKIKALISYIDTNVDPEKRTLAIRAEVMNPKQELKPGMLATAFISTKPEGSSKVLSIPRSAVLWTGKRSIVYVQPDSGMSMFEAREVELGSRTGDRYIITSGLSEGDLVVINGTFKLDAAAQLADKLSMMNRDPGKNSTPGGMMNMDM